MGFHTDPGSHSPVRCWRNQCVPSACCHHAPAKHRDVHEGRDTEQRGGVAWLRAGSALKERSQWSFHLFSWRELAVVCTDTASGLTGAKNSP